MAETKTITVLGMSCEHCEMRVQKAVMAVAGVLSAKASAKEKQVTVEVDASADLDAVKTAIEDAGYDIG